MATTQRAVRAPTRSLTALTLGSVLLGGFGLGAAGAQDLPGSVSISGSVFDDADRNGLFGGDENGLAGVVVELRDLSGNLVAVTVTGFNGVYAFTDLEPGTYTVSEVGNPSGFPDDTTASSVVVDAFAPLSGVDFGNAGTGTGGLPGSVQAQVFTDLDRSGTLDFTEQDRVANAQVRIIGNTGEVLAELVTDSFGVASWTAPADPIEVLLDVELPAGLQATTPLSTFVRLESGQFQTIDIGATDPNAPARDDTTDPTDATRPGGGTTTDPTTPDPGATSPDPESTQRTGGTGSTTTTTTATAASPVLAPAAPASASTGSVALPLAPAASLTSSGASAAAGTVVLGERASAGSNVQDTTVRRTLAATGQDSARTASQGAALLATGVVLTGAGSLLRRTRRPALAPVPVEGPTDS